jgi:hypothetical protein
MLKTKSAEERLEGYKKSNPREVMDFSREDARKMNLQTKQVTMHGKG